ncbi:MAG: hypothetical protein ACREEP_04745, partial [Dongiaceae bacterium]
MIQQSQPSVPPPQASWAEVTALLKDNKLRDFRLDIETESTIAPDPDAEQTARVNFMQVVGQFLQGALPAVAAGQVPAEVALQMLLFVVRGFTVGRELESTLEAWG